MAGQWAFTAIPHGRSDSEWAWAAGLFEGEGCVYRPRRTQQTSPAGGAGMVINMCDRDVLERFTSIVGVGKFSAIKRAGWMKPHWKDQFKWITTKFSDVMMLYGQFQPWLGQRRRDKFEEIIAHPPRNPKDPRKTHCKNGHPLSGELAQVRIDKSHSGGKTRMCRICDRANKARSKARIKALRTQGQSK